MTRRQEDVKIEMQEQRLTDRNKAILFIFFSTFKSLTGKVSEKNNCSLKLKKRFNTATFAFSRNQNKFELKKLKIYKNHFVIFKKKN